MPRPSETGDYPHLPVGVYYLPLLHYAAYMHRCFNYVAFRRRFNDARRRMCFEFTASRERPTVNIPVGVLTYACPYYVRVTEFDVPPRPVRVYTPRRIRHVKAVLYCDVARTRRGYSNNNNNNT